MKMIVEAYEKGLKFRDGRFVEVLGPGRHAVRTLFARERIETVDMRLRTMILQGQEVMTLDKVTIRLSALIQLKVKDPVAALLTVDNYASQLYGQVQLALRDHIGSVAFDALLQEKGRIGERILDEVKLDAAAYGVELVDVGIRDLVLPGEMKSILNKVMEAQKKAEASLIARREEVAATRSLANTAQLLEKNPVLMRLKELEALEKIAANGGSVVVSPELFGFAKETVKRID